MSSAPVSDHELDTLVLDHAIESKRATIDLMKSAQEGAQADLLRLREFRAIRLARAKGFEVGQVWLVNENSAVQPGILYEIKPGGSGIPELDWKLTFVFGRVQYGSSPRASVHATALNRIVGRVESGCIVESLREFMARIVAEQERATA